MNEDLPMPFRPASKVKPAVRIVVALWDLKFVIVISFIIVVRSVE
jgi:hypothetical protein